MVAIYRKEGMVDSCMEGRGSREGGREEGGGVERAESDLGAIGQTEIEAKVGEDLSSFICADFTQNIIFAI